MIDLVQFQPYIYPVLPELSDMEFIANTRRACIEFCRKTQVWQMDLDPIDIVAGQQVYTMTLPTDADLSKVMRVIIDGVDQIPLSEKPAGSSFGYAPYYTVNISTNQITLVKSPLDNVPAGLQICIALKPTITAFQVPEILLSQYPEAISYGALGNLCAMVGRPFSDFEMAKQYREDFRHAINSAASDALYGFSRAVLETIPAYI